MPSNHDADHVPTGAGRVACITGASHALGRELIRRLEADPRWQEIVALDIRRPNDTQAAHGTKTTWISLDLTQPDAPARLLEVLRKYRVDTFVHAAFLSYPTKAVAWARQLEERGTLHVARACAQSRLRQFVMMSSSLVYGPRADQAPPCDEHQATAQNPIVFIADKIAAERHVETLAHDRPDTTTTILRFAPIVGPTIENFFTRYLSKPALPYVLGHDPLVQLLDERDANRAFKLAIDRAVRGKLNIVGRGVLTYSQLAERLGKVRIPLPYGIARSLSNLMWSAQIGPAPGDFIDYLRHPCIANGERAARELGFTAEFDLHETLRDFANTSV